MMKANITELLARASAFVMSLERRLNGSVGGSKFNWGVVLLSFVGIWCLGRLFGVLVYFFG